MDPLSIHNIKAINKYKKQEFISYLVLYTLTTMSCCLLIFSPFWYPPLRTAVNVFLLYVSLPKLVSIFFSAKVVFIVGNLIVIFLVGDQFKIYTLVVPHPSETTRGATHRQSFNKKRGNSEIPKNNKKMHLQLAKGTSTDRIKVDRCEAAQYGEHLGADHQMQMISVTNKVILKHDETSVLFREDCGKKSGAEELKKSHHVKDDLNKMADDFIARVNKQRRLEAELYI